MRVSPLHAYGSCGQSLMQDVINVNKILTLINKEQERIVPMHASANCCIEGYTGNQYSTQICQTTPICHFFRYN